MSTNYFVSRVFSGAACVALLAGCSAPVGSVAAASESTTAGQLQSTNQVRDSVSARSPSQVVAGKGTASTGNVIVSALGADEVDIFSDTLKPVTKITGIGFPAGLALDAIGNLYVANAGSGSPGILVYANDYKTLVATLADPHPSLGVAVDPVTGVVAGINGGPGNVGSVTFFPKGSSTPCANLAFANLLDVFQGAFDSAGNLYVTAQDLNHVQVVGVIQGGCSATSITLLSTANSFSSFIFGIQITRFGKIAVEDNGNRVIYTYNPPLQGSLGTPIATTQLIGASAPEQFAFTEKGAFIFVADEGRSETLKYAYPAGGAALQAFAPKALAQVGLVVTPPTQP